MNRTGNQEAVLRKCAELEELGVKAAAVSHIRNQALRERPDLAPNAAVPRCRKRGLHRWREASDRDGGCDLCVRCGLKRFASPLPSATDSGGYVYVRESEDGEVRALVTSATDSGGYVYVRSASE